MTMAKWLVFAGGVLMGLGLLLHVAPGLFSWFGRLPGDIRVGGERGTVFVPISSMLIVSTTLLFNLFRR